MNQDLSLEATHNVYGVLIFLLLAHQGRLAKDGALAPNLAQQIELNRMSALAWADCARVMQQCEKEGTTYEQVLRPLDGISYADIEERLRPGDWWERVVKTYITIGTFSDYQRIVVENVNARFHTIPEDFAKDNWAEEHEQWTVDLLRQGESDPTLAPRMSLWGRRVLGDVIHLLSMISHQCPAMFSSDAEREDVHQRINQLHNERMKRAGLAG